MNCSRPLSMNFASMNHSFASFNDPVAGTFRIVCGGMITSVSTEGVALNKEGPSMLEPPHEV